MLIQTLVLLLFFQSTTSQGKSYSFSASAAIVIITCTPPTDCSSCLQTTCGMRGPCRLFLHPQADCISSVCLVARENAIIECSTNATNHRLLALDSDSVRSGSCAANIQASAHQDNIVPIGPESYIINSVYRFCSSYCIGKVWIGSTNPTNSTSENPIEFHTFKRYKPHMQGSSNNDDIFVEQVSFNVTLNYNNV